MNLVRTLVVLGCVAAVSACAANRRCSVPQSYENALTIPAIVGVEGLRVPTTSTALKVPDAKGEALTFGFVTPDPKKPGKTQVLCLDSPPAIPPNADVPK